MENLVLKVWRGKNINSIKINIMKKSILTTITLFVSLIVFSQNHTQIEKMIFERVNEFRIMNDVEPLDFSPIAYEIAKNNSKGNYNSTGLKLDIVLTKPYGVEGTFISNSITIYSTEDGRRYTDEEIVDVIMECWTNNIEKYAYLLVSFDVGNGELYSGGVGSAIESDKYFFTLVTHERKQSVSQKLDKPNNH